jgi:hypothetical protein
VLGTVPLDGSTTQPRVEPSGLPSEVVAFGEIGCRPGSLGVEPGRGDRVIVALVQVCRDGGIARQAGIEPARA